MVDCISPRVRRMAHTCDVLVCLVLLAAFWIRKQRRAFCVYMLVRMNCPPEIRSLSIFVLILHRPTLRRRSMPPSQSLPSLRKSRPPLPTTLATTCNTTVSNLPREQYMPLDLAQPDRQVRAFSNARSRNRKGDAH